MDVCPFLPFLFPHTVLSKYDIFVLFYFIFQGEQRKMIGASSLLDSKQNITENFFALMQEENEAFEQKT